MVEASAHTLASWPLRAEDDRRDQAMRAFVLIIFAVLLGALAGYATAGSLQLFAAIGSGGSLLLAATPK